VTGFFSTECWHQWVVTNPVMQGNGPVIFTDASGRLAVFPATDLREFDAVRLVRRGRPGNLLVVPLRWARQELVRP
jgi:hypothetical protein